MNNTSTIIRFSTKIALKVLIYLIACSFLFEGVVFSDISMRNNKLNNSKDLYISNISPVSVFKEKNKNKKSSSFIEDVTKNDIEIFSRMNDLKSTKIGLLSNIMRVIKINLLILLIPAISFCGDDMTFSMGLTWYIIKDNLFSTFLIASFFTVLSHVFILYDLFYPLWVRFIVFFKLSPKWFYEHTAVSLSELKGILNSIKSNKKIPYLLYYSSNSTYTKEDILYLKNLRIALNLKNEKFIKYIFMKVLNKGPYVRYRALEMIRFEKISNLKELLLILMEDSEFEIRIFALDIALENKLSNLEIFLDAIRYSNFRLNEFELPSDIKISNLGEVLLKIIGNSTSRWQIKALELAVNANVSNLEDILIKAINYSSSGLNILELTLKNGVSNLGEVLLQSIKLHYSEIYIRALELLVMKDITFLDKILFDAIKTPNNDVRLKVIELAKRIKFSDLQKLEELNKNIDKKFALKERELKKVEDEKFIKLWGNSEWNENLAIEKAKRYYKIDYNYWLWNPPNQYELTYDSDFKNYLLSEPKLEDYIIREMGGNYRRDIMHFTVTKNFLPNLITVNQENSDIKIDKIINLTQKEKVPLLSYLRKLLDIKLSSNIQKPIFNISSVISRAA